MGLENRLDYSEIFNQDTFNYLMSETTKYLNYNEKLGAKAFYEAIYEWEKIETLEEYRMCAKKLIKLISTIPISLRKKEELLDIYTQTASEILPQL